MAKIRRPERRAAWGAGRSRKWRRLYRLIFMFPITGLGAMFLIGVLAWGGFNWSLELTNTEKFCISCHEMKEFLYKDYKQSIHYSNRTGVKASCPDCHVPRDWVHKVIRKVAATNELFHWLRGSINTREKFEAKRFELASAVWENMKDTDSRECRNCHGAESMLPEAQTSRAYTMHGLAVAWSMTCIECHQGIAHSLPKKFDKNPAMDKLHDLMEKEGVECKLCHESLTRAPAGDGWD